MLIMVPHDEEIQNNGGGRYLQGRAKAIRRKNCLLLVNVCFSRIYDGDRKRREGVRGQ